MNYLEIDNKLISTPLWDIVLDIKNQLRNGKLRIVKLQGTKNIRITCPHHNNGLERNADCDIYIGPTLKNHSGEIIVAYGTVKCFACDFKTDFVGFVAECFEISYEDAETWLLDNYCDGIIQYQQELAPELSLNKKQIRNYIDESILDTLQSYHPYMEERKITREVAKEFEVKYNPQTKYLVFPVRDEKGQLVMFTQRSIEGKTFIIDAEKVKPVYLLYYLKKRNIQEAYVCESQINALTL
jgi:hypothetical protein